MISNSPTECCRCSSFQSDPQHVYVSGRMEPDGPTWRLSTYGPRYPEVSAHLIGLQAVRWWRARESEGERCGGARTEPRGPPWVGGGGGRGGLLGRSGRPARAAAPGGERGDLVWVKVEGLIPPATPVPSPNTEPTPAPPPPPNAILALRAGQIAPLWRLDVPGDIAPWALADDSTLYAMVSGLDPSAPPFCDLSSIDARDCNVRWQLALQSTLPSYSVPVESGGGLFFSGQYCACRSLIPSTMLAVRASDGKVLWQKTAPDGVVTTGIVVTGGMVSYSYARANNDPGGGIIALHAADGSPGWQVSWPSAIPDSVVGGDGVLYAATVAPSGREGQLAVVAYNVPTGAPLFDRPLPRLPVQLDSPPGQGRSEERRVGKECRSRWSPYH